MSSPYPSSARTRPSERALLECPGPFKIDLERFRRVCFGYVLGMVPKGAQRVPQGFQKETPGGDFEGKGGIPKVVSPLI